MLKDYTAFEKEVLPYKEIAVGNRIVVDTSDFSIVDYDNIDVLAIKFLGEKFGD